MKLFTTYSMDESQIRVIEKGYMNKEGAGGMRSTTNCHDVEPLNMLMRNTIATK